MKKILSLLIAVAGMSVLFSCNNYETYADQKEKERDAINKFISDRGINVISEETFHAQNDVTNNNEYVYMNNTGVYMNIERRGAGKPLQDKETCELFIRFAEYSVFDTTKVVTNKFTIYDPDIMNVSRTGTTYTASFTYGTMISTYGASVPSGWLVPIKYINVGSSTENEMISLVKLIIPHTQGHTVASGNVTPYYYEISFQKAPGL
jgi:hypothetical protein